MKFAPLHINSGYSLLQSGLTFEPLFNAIKTNKYEGVGLCDIDTLSGLPEFNQYCKNNNVKGINGLDIKVTIENATWNLSLFCVNEEGYRSLLRLSNIAMTSTVKYEDLNKEK
ncbi:MAG: PHP domain-containing protein, partial [Bacilli bacterium]|nr:PHP domain-containing protein [Bacilli bacterium]